MCVENNFKKRNCVKERRGIRGFFFKIYLFLAVAGLHGCKQAFSRCGKQDLSVVVCGLLIVVDSLVAEHRL